MTSIPICANAVFTYCANLSLSSRFQVFRSTLNPFGTPASAINFLAAAMSCLRCATVVSTVDLNESITESLATSPAPPRTPLMKPARSRVRAAALRTRLSMNGPKSLRMCMWSPPQVATFVVSNLAFGNFDASWFKIKPIESSFPVSNAGTAVAAETY